MKVFRSRLVLTAFAACLTLIAIPLIAEPAIPRAIPRAVNGILDLRTWDFSTQGPVPMAGEWQFYAGRLLSQAGIGNSTPPLLRHIPDHWENSDAGGKWGQGAGTYRLKILLPHQPNSEVLAIHTATVPTAFEMDINGILATAAGHPDIDPSLAIPAYNPAVVRIETPANSLDIIIRVSNYEYRSGGLWRNFEIGPESTLLAKKQRTYFISLSLCVGIAVIALNYLVFFLFRRKERSYLYFALFALVVAVRPLVTGEYLFTELFGHNLYVFMIRFEYCATYLVFPLAIVFAFNMFPGMANTFMRWILLAPYAPLVAAALIVPLPILTRSIFLFYPLCIAGMISLVGVLLVRAWLQKRPDSLIILIGGCILMLATINDILNTVFLISVGNLLPIGLAAFVCLQAVVLARRFTAAFDGVEHLSAEMMTLNDKLEVELKRGLETQNYLASALDEKEMLIKEIHHRVKNSLQIVSSIISLQSNRSNDQAVLDFYQSLRLRIRAISLVHEKLYGAVTTDTIELGSYLRDLLALLVSSYNTSEGVIDIDIKAPSILVHIDFCIDAGLLLTELVSNAIKHCVMPIGRGAVHVLVWQNDQAIIIEIRDNGSGFPPGFKPEQAETLGYRLVNTILRRSKGSFAIIPDNCGLVRLTLPFVPHQA